MFIHDSPPLCHMSIPFHSASDLLGDIVDRLTRAPRVQAKHGVTTWLDWLMQCIHSISTNRASLLDLQDPAMFESIQFGHSLLHGTICNSYQFIYDMI